MIYSAPSPPSPSLGPPLASDEQIVAEVLGGERNRFAWLMRRYNQRLYRVCRSVLQHDGEAEEAVQEAYLRAYAHLGSFAGRSRFATWLTRIALYEALARRRRMRLFTAVDANRDELAPLDPPAKGPSPEQQTINDELRSVLETAIDALPETYRTVFVLRQVEGLTTKETADCLQIGREAVKSRLHRSRQMLRTDIREHYGHNGAAAFPFLGRRCDHMVEAVFARLDETHPATDPSPASL